MSDANTTTEQDTPAREFSPVPGRNPATVPQVLHGLVQQFLDEAGPIENFWTWLQRGADVEGIIAMERRRRAAGVTTCDECGAVLAPEESRGIPPATYCVDCAFRDEFENDPADHVLLVTATPEGSRAEWLCGPDAESHSTNPSG